MKKFILLVVSISFLTGCSTSEKKSSEPFKFIQYQFPIKEPNFPFDHASLEYPVFFGSNNKKLLEKINYHIGPEAVLGKTPEDLDKDFKDGLVPFISARSDLIYYGKGLAQFLWTVTTFGAYTSTSRITVLVDLEKGITHGPESMFEDDLLVARYVNSRMEGLIQESLNTLFLEHPDAQSTLSDMGIPIPYGPDDLFNLHITNEGLRFVYYFKFPQSFASIEPEPLDLFVPWADLRPFFYEGCIFERFYKTVP